MRKEKIGCGVFATGQDEVSHTIDLHFQYKNNCVALGRFAWSSDPSGELDLNIAECGEPRPASPSYYLMRPGGNLDCTCLDENGCTIAEVQTTAFSGRFGYGLLGDYGFVGSLTKEQLTDPAWHLEGEFEFSTAGYVVETPVVRIQESYPEQVSVTIDVTPPSPDSVVAQVITHVAVSLDITMSNEALFTIRTRTCDDGSEGEGEGEGEPGTPNNPLSIFGCYFTEKQPA